MNSRQINLSRQLGSTLMGVVIGLVIGLSIAVAVALLITKTSTPFTNKNGKTDKTDVPVTQMQDPNKPLYGNKDAAKEAAKEFVKATDSSKAAETVDTKPDAKPEIKTPAVTAEKQVADSGDEKYIYFLQTGAFRELADAESARAKLALIGFEAKVSEKPSDTGNLYRVRIGPFSQLETMNRMRAKLSENSVDVAVVRTTK
ncbi:MAG: SPOR domain-containing protein [Pseudomonadota bacterium]